MALPINVVDALALTDNHYIDPFGFFPAFPGAYGWGAGSVGGRGGTIIEVTNLNNTGSGSLRDAVGTAGRRIIVFRVAGEIQLTSTIQVVQPFMTIAGQTAPGNGIVITGGGIRVRSSHHIIRYLSWRGGANDFFRTAPANDCHDVIVDHCSIAWSDDDSLAVAMGTGEEDHSDIRRITIQNCILGEPLDVHPTTMIVNAIIGQEGRVNRVSIHNNFTSAGSHRNPLVGESLRVEVINNVVYNWKNEAMSFQNESECDFVNNYFERGPTMNDAINRKVFAFDENDSAGDLPSLYIAGNIVPDASVGLTDPTVDNWTFDPNILFNRNTPPNDFPDAKRDPHTRLALPLIPVPERLATVAFNAVPEEAGNIRRLNADGTFTLRRDSIDQRLVDELRSQTGVSDSRVNAGIPDPVDPGTLYIDTDGDGMADEYEDLNGLDKNSAADQNGEAASNGYTNIENFLNGVPILEQGGPAGL